MFRTAALGLEEGNCWLLRKNADLGCFQVILGQREKQKVEFCDSWPTSTCMP